MRRRRRKRPPGARHAQRAAGFAPHPSPCSSAQLQAGAPAPAPSTPSPRACSTPLILHSTGSPARIRAAPPVTTANARLSLRCHSSTLPRPGSGGGGRRRRQRGEPGRGAGPGSRWVHGASGHPSPPARTRRSGWDQCLCGRPAGRALRRPRGRPRGRSAPLPPLKNLPALERAGCAALVRAAPRGLTPRRRLQTRAWFPAARRR